MRLSAHPERKTAFERLAQEHGLLHGKNKPHSPWQNGIVERSHRTDNEELFHMMQFTDPEERRYQLKLWEFYYNNDRPHQGLKGMTPFQVFKEQYSFETHIRMLT